MTSDGRIYPVHIAGQRGTYTSEQLPNVTSATATAAAIPLHHTMNLANLQQHLQLPQHQQQSVGGMQFMAYPSFIGMPNQQSQSPSQYSFVQSNQNYNHNHNYNYNHNHNMSLQPDQMLDPNVTFQIPTGLVNSQQASMYPRAASMVPTTNNMQVYTDPMAAMAAAVIQRTAVTRPQVEAPYQILDKVVSNPSNPSTSISPPPQSRFVLPQRSNQKYRDYALDAESNEPYDEPGAASGKDHSFPVKLHRILSDPEFREYICWMPHGRSWKILKQDEFEDKVIPLFFRHGKLSSFMRQINGWGFRRMPAGPEKNTYYHEMLLRGFPYLSAMMRRPVEKIRSTSDLKAHPNFHNSKLFVALPREPQVITSGVTSNNDTDSNTGSDSNDSGSGSGRISGFETDITANASNDGSGSDQGCGVNMSHLYDGSNDSSSVLISGFETDTATNATNDGTGSDQGCGVNMSNLYGGSSGGIDQGSNLYGGSDQGSTMLGSGGSEQGSHHYGSDNGSNGEPNGLSDANNDSNSSDGTGSDNGTKSDASFSFNPRSRSMVAESASSYNHQQMVYRQLAREAQLNATRAISSR